MATRVEGIAASENIDSSGERLLMAGMDITSLATTGTFTWEHKKDTPSQVVGKILKAKKIFKEEDCDNERELYFWNKCGVPYVYVIGELFDEFCESSKHIAGLLRYDHSKKDENQHDVVGFSIEGSKIEKNGNDITRSIARVVTLTIAPCNKMALAEMVIDKKSKKQDSELDSIFKTEPTIEIKMFKEQPISFNKDERDFKKHADMLGLPVMAKATPSIPHPKATAPAAPMAQSSNSSSHIGSTTSGRKVYSHAKTHEYSNFSSKDHYEAANHHYNAAKATKDPKLGAHHFNQTKMHTQAGTRTEAKEKRFDVGRAGRATTKLPLTKSEVAFTGAKGSPISLKNGDKVNIKGSKSTHSYKGSFKSASGKTVHAFTGPFGNDTHIHDDHLHSNSVTKLTKALEAGSGLSVPGSITQGAALQCESVEPTLKKPWDKNKKSKNLAKEEVCLPKKDFVDEHKNLVGILRNPTKKKLDSEAKGQSKELKDLNKKKWLDRAKEEYDNWGKKEEFRSFMSKSMPNLTMSEIDAIGQTMVLKKSIEAEEALAKLINN